MTLKRSLWMPSRNNVTWKLIGLSNDSSKGSVGPVRCFCFERNLVCAMVQARAVGLMLKIMPFIYFETSIWKDKKKKKKIGRLRKRGVTRQNSRGGPFSVHKSYSNANLTLCRQLDMCLTQVNIYERLKSLIITLMNIYHFKQSGIATDVRKPVLPYELLITAMLFIPSYTNFSVSIYICGLIVLWVPAVWMCQLYFIGCLELFVYSKVPTESTALCCFSTVIHPLPCIYPPLRSQTMQQQHRPTSDTSYFKHYYAMRLFFSRNDGQRIQAHWFPPSKVYLCLLNWHVVLF